MKRATTILRTRRRKKILNLFFCIKLQFLVWKQRRKIVKYYLAVFYQTCLLKPVLEETSDVAFRVGWVVAPFALTRYFLDTTASPGIDGKCVAAGA